MVEKLEDFVLEVAYYGVLEQLLCVGVLKPYLVGTKAGDGYLELVVEHEECYLELHALMVVAYLEHFACASFHGSIDDDDPVAQNYLLKEGSLTYLEVLLHDGAAKTFHLYVGDFDGLSVCVVVVSDGYPEAFVQPRCYQLVGEAVRAIDEDESAEVAAQCIAVHHRVVDAVRVFVGGLGGDARLPVDFVVRDVVAARRKESVVRRGVIVLALFRLEQFPYQRGAGMHEDVPIATFLDSCFRVDIVIRLHIRYPLSAAGGPAGLFMSRRTSGVVFPLAFRAIA